MQLLKDVLLFSIYYWWQTWRWSGEIRLSLLHMRLWEIRNILWFCNNATRYNAAHLGISLAHGSVSNSIRLPVTIFSNVLNLSPVTKDLLAEVIFSTWRVCGWRSPKAFVTRQSLCQKPLHNRNWIT